MGPQRTRFGRLSMRWVSCDTFRGSRHTNEARDLRRARSQLLGCGILGRAGPSSGAPPDAPPKSIASGAAGPERNICAVIQTRKPRLVTNQKGPRERDNELDYLIRAERGSRVELCCVVLCWLANERNGDRLGLGNRKLFCSRWSSLVRGPPQPGHG